MSFWKKKDNLIITAVVALFFIGFVFWNDLCSVRAALPGSSNDPSAIHFTDQHQKQLTLKQFKGKPLIVNFWATWCPVCVKKMGTLNNFAKHFQEKGGKIVSLSEDSGGLSTVRAYYARHSYKNLEVFLDSSGQLMNAFGASGLPTSIFINAEGQEVARIEGGVDWGSKDILDMVHRHFGIRVAP